MAEDKKQVSFRTSPVVHQALQEACAMRNCTVGELLEAAFVQFQQPTDGLMDAIMAKLVQQEHTLAALEKGVATLVGVIKEKVVPAQAPLPPLERYEDLFSPLASNGTTEEPAAVAEEAPSPRSKWWGWGRY